MRGVINEDYAYNVITIKFYNQQIEIFFMVEFFFKIHIFCVHHKFMKGILSEFSSQEIFYTLQKRAASSSTLQINIEELLLISPASFIAITKS